ncbi:ROK family protein [Novosphingobium mathurense]|uniref:fructokinase n=1 Tax=Novosphingobium mathurense TaxID=428990 RepID=A0A1U6IVI7_9SPHN|nr:ROK family protein [Novosphingobium mathurense]SLK12003.1 fructokinase [Novosphingobium mathurense]
MTQGSPPRLAGIELGGTKTIVTLGDGTRILESHALPTATPDETLEAALAQLAAWQAASPLAAIGIASFGPIRVTPDAADYGTILRTPKPGWSNTGVLEWVHARFACPIGVDTDVNAAALAEHAFGAGQGCSSLVYITIGTGLGAGIVVDGRPVHGLLHPELGHIRTRRAPGATFAGTCPFHGDCIEGLISGPALEARLPAHPGKLDPASPAWDEVVHDLAELLSTLVLSLSPQRIIIGGGVATRQPHLVERARTRLPAILAGYLPDLDHAAIERMICLPALGANAGPVGSLLLAHKALISDKI